MAELRKAKRRSLNEGELHLPGIGVVEMKVVQSLWTRAQVAQFFQVKERMVSDWEKAGKIKCVYTPGGAPRYEQSEIDRVLASSQIKQN